MDYPRICLVGGTGHLGRGLAVRLGAAGYPIFIGSRRLEKAKRAAFEVEHTLYKHGVEPLIGYGENTEVIRKSDIVILTIPYEALSDIIPVVRECIKKHSILVSPIVPMEDKDGILHPIRIREGSVAVLIKNKIPKAKVVAAFHTVPYRALLKYPEPIIGDVLVFGDNEDAVELVSELVYAIPQLRPIYGGGLEHAFIVEQLVPLLINICRRLKKSEISLKFIWSSEEEKFCNLFE